MRDEVGGGVRCGLDNAAEAERFGNGPIVTQPENGASGPAPARGCSLALLLLAAQQPHTEVPEARGRRAGQPAGQRPHALFMGSALCQA